MFFFILAKLYFLFLLYFTQLPQYHSYNVLYYAKYYFIFVSINVHAPFLVLFLDYKVFLITTSCYL
jgi:hypothetical protein